MDRPRSCLVPQRRYGACDSRFRNGYQVRYAQSKAYYGRGNIRQSQGEMDKAMAEFNRTIELNPRFAEAYINRGKLRYGRNDQEGAFADPDV